MAALVKEQLRVETDLSEGDRGEFTVWVGDRLVSKKDAHGFPSDDDALAAVRRALAADESSDL